MSLSNYSDLKTSIANYLGRSDLTSQIPDFITLAEIRLSRELRIRQMLTSGTISVTLGDSTFPIPSNFLAIRDIYLDGNPRITLSYMSPSAFSREARATEVGVPTMYTMNGTDFEVAPIPQQAYTAKVLYYGKPTALSNINTTNVFLENAADALLYASLLEAEPYLMNDARVQVWANLYNNAVNNLNSSDEESEYAGVPLTMTYVVR